MASFEAENFDFLFADIVDRVYNLPDYEVEPRGQRVRELLAPTLILTNPRARLLASPARKADYGFGVGEFFWYLLGKQDVDSMLYYNKRMGQFSDNGFTLNSAYGYRARVKPYGNGTQWSKVRNELLRDPDSRRAVLIIGEAIDFVEAEHSKDVPCTLSLQFFIRDEKLHLHTTMRSNDAFWGLTYDLFSFTLLQEFMLLELQEHEGFEQLTLGRYSHTAGSLHIYERHFEMASDVVKQNLFSEFRPAAPMEPISLSGLAALAEDEAALRSGKVAQIGPGKYAGGVGWMAEQLDAHRRKRDDERGRQVGPGDGARPA
jgi:thymidylate synthase